MSTNSAWGKDYAAWELLPFAATAETVREAMSYERQGWPMPISGDMTRTGSCCESCAGGCPQLGGKEDTA